MNFNISILPNLSFENQINYSQIKAISVDPKEIHDLVQKMGWSPYIYKDNKRSKVNFKSASIIGIDIDGELPFLDTIKILTAKNLQYSITFTKSHQVIKGNKSACDRYRIILFLQDEINNVLEMKKTLALIQKKMFPQLDSQCLDLARMFFASTSSFNAENAILNTQGDRLSPDIHLKETLLEKALETPNLPKSIEYFLNNPLEACRKNEWNINLNKTTFYLASIDWSEDDIEKLLESIAPSSLDSKDREAFKSAFSAGEKNKCSTNDNKVSQFIKAFQVLELEIKDIHLLESPEGSMSILSSNNSEIRYVNQSFLKKRISNTLLAHGYFKSVSDIKNHTDHFIDTAIPLKDEPPLVCFKSYKGLSFRKLDFDPTLGSCPIFQELLSRCENADAVAAFIWSIFELGSDLQQYLWIFGNGQDGKGALGKLLAKLLGNTYCSETSRGVQNDKYYTSNFIGKRLVNYPDNNDPKLTTCEQFKILTGGDSIRIEAKYGSAYTKRLDLKFLIFSNKLPEISTQKSDQRRAIISYISPFSERPNPQYNELLWEERAEILDYCKSVYERIVVNHGPIPTDIATNKYLGERTEELNSFVFDEYFELDKQSSLTPNEFYKHSYQACKEHGVLFKEFKLWSMKQNSLTEERIEGKERKLIGLRLKNQSLHSNSFNDKNISIEI